MDSKNRYHGAYKPVPRPESLQIHALRGLSAIGVAVGHANQFMVAPTNNTGNAAFGLIAQGSVMVFFVLSGFLIGKSICRNIEDHGGDQFSFGQYATDRLWRIYPPLLFAVALMAAIWLLAPALLPSGTTQFLSPTSDYARHGINFDFNSVRYTLIFRNGFVVGSPDMNGPLWSLSIEVWYYIIAGVAVALLRRPLLSLLSVLMILHLIGRNDDFTDFAPVWIAGYILSIAHNRDYLPGRIMALGFAASALAAMTFGVLFAFPELSPGTNWIRHYNVAIGFAFAIMLGAIVGGHVRLPRLFTRAFAGAAKYSYTLYLIHVPIYLLIFGMLEPYIVGNLAASIFAAAGALVIVVGLASLVAKVVENKKLPQLPLRLRAARPAG